MAALEESRDGLMSDFGFDFWQSVAAGAIRAGTPLVFAGLGELIYERAGVLNLGVEGMMLAGALAGVAAQVWWGNWMLSVSIAILTGVILGVLHALVCVALRANQVAVGLAFVILLEGATAFFGRELVGQRVVAAVPVADALPTMFRHDILAYAAIALTFVVWWCLSKTRSGVVLRAVGENAEAAAVRGVPVQRVRLIAGALCGGACALGGAYLSLVYAGQWQEGMTTGRGWIAIVLVICATWRPRVLLAAGYLFGGLTALQLNLQAAGVTVSPYLLSMLPFVLSIVVLVVANLILRTSPTGMPADLGRPFVPRTASRAF